MRGFKLIELMIVVAIMIVMAGIAGCSPAQIKADIELKIANDIKPVAVKDLQSTIVLSNSVTPPYLPGVLCGQGMTDWFNALPAPAPLPGSSVCAPGDTTSTDCLHVDGLASAAVAVHLAALQAQTAPVTLPPIDTQTRAYCLLMFADTGNDVNQALRKFGALAGGLALGKGTLNAAAANGFAAGLATPKP